MAINKRHWHHVWRYLRGVHPWYFVAIAIVFGVLALLSLRQNNEQMVTYRNAVYEADKNNGDVERALRTLREYVYGHMNTSLTTGPNAVHPPIQLKYTYERLQAEQARSASNEAVYNEAQAYCQQQNPTDFSGSARVPCIEQYVLSHGVKVATIPDALYKFDFTSARWSFDRAGWSIIAATLSALLAAVTIGYRVWVKKNL